MYLGSDISNDKAGEKKHDMFDDGRIYVTTRNLPAYRTVNLDNRNDIQDDNDTPNVRGPLLLFSFSDTSISITITVIKLEHRP